MEIDLNKNSYCLTVNERRYELLADNFRRVGLNPPFKFNGYTHEKFSSEKNTSHHCLCSVGHMNIIFSAQCHMLPYVIVFEDDAYPNDNVIQMFNNLMEDVSKVDWDILVLGIAGEYPGTNHNINNLNMSYQQIKDLEMPLIKNTSSLTYTIPKLLCGAHAYIIKRNGYNKFLKKIIDCTAPVDSFLVESGCKTIISKKLLFIQRFPKMLHGKECMFSIYPQFYNEEELAIGPMCCRLGDVPKGFSK